MSRVYLGLTRSRILLVWVMLELNIIRVLPLLRFDGGVFRGELRIKYFLIQAWGSAIFLVGLLLAQLRDFTGTLIELALALKLGAAPLHFWFVRVLRVRRLEVLFLLSTLQKVLPLRIFQWLSRGGLSGLLVVLRALTAGWGIFNHRNLRGILAYSSIFTVAWCLARLTGSLWMWARYLFIYGVGLLGMVILISESNSRRVSHLQLRHRRGAARLILFFGLATLGGLPPLGRFWVKVMVLVLLIQTGDLLRAGILMLGSIWVLYAYMRLRFLASSLGGVQGPWRRRSLNDRLFLPVIIVVALPLILMLRLYLLRGVTRKILIFKILEQSKLGT